MRGSAWGAAYRPVSACATALQSLGIAANSKFPHRLQEVTPQSLDAHVRLVKLRAVRWQNRAERKRRPIPMGREGSERRSASMPGAARPEFDPVSAADVFSELSPRAPRRPRATSRAQNRSRSRARSRDHPRPGRAGERPAQHSIGGPRYSGGCTQAAGHCPGVAGPCHRQPLRGARHLGRGRHGHRVPLPRPVQRPIRGHQARDSALRQPAGRVRDVVLQGGACARRLGPSEHRASARLRAIAGWLAVLGDGARVGRVAPRAGPYAAHVPADLDDSPTRSCPLWRTPMRAASSTET